jgi:putative transposase
MLYNADQVKYAMIKSHEKSIPNMMYRMLSVSRSGYYRWKQQPVSDRSRAIQLLTDDIKRVFDDEKGRPGSPRITQRLQAEGKSVGRHQVAKIMRDIGRRAEAAIKYKATPNDNHPLPVAPNLLEQNQGRFARSKMAVCYHLYLDR